MALTLSVVLASDSSRAQRGADEAFDERTEEDCIVVRRIDKTSVVDDTTILFYMRGNGIYRNRLDRSCPRLEAADRFSYTVSTGRLCRNDTITVIEPFDRLPGFTCGLGQFRPITAEEAELLEQGPEAADDGIEIETIDVPVEDAEDSEAEPDAAGPAGDAELE